MKNEYPDVGDLSDGRDIRIVHHSKFIKELLEKKDLVLKEDEVTGDLKLEPVVHEAKVFEKIYLKKQSRPWLQF